MNWRNLPFSLRRDLYDLEAKIRPTDPTNDLEKDITEIFNRTATSLCDRVNRHFTERLQANRTTLANLDSMDMAMAKEIAFDQIRKSISKTKLTDYALKTLIREEASHIGKQSRQPETTPPENLERPHNTHIHSGSTFIQTDIPTENRFEILMDYTEPDEQTDEGNTQTPLQQRPPKRRRSASSPSVPTTPGASQTSTPHAEANLEALVNLLSEDAPANTSTVPPPQNTLTRTPNTREHETHANTPLSSKSIHPTADKMRKKQEQWRIKLDTHADTLIIADSNLRFIETDQLPDRWQLAVLPGAKLEHMPGVLSKIQHGRLTNIILAVGINNRTESSEGPTLDITHPIQTQLVNKAKHAFTVGISISDKLHPKEHAKCLQINKVLANLKGVTYINPQRPEETETLPGFHNMHHNKCTVNKIWSSIITAVNTHTPKN